MKSKAGFFLVLTAVVISGCSEGKGKNYEVINKDADGRLSVINQSSGQVLVINKSNRIEDVISLNLDKGDVEKIWKEKSTQDAAIKIREWSDVGITGTKYSVQLATRYYKDRMLYKLTFSPADGTTPLKARSVSINLLDENGFVLETIKPSPWATVVDEKSKPMHEQANGEVPMTLDNYLQVRGYGPSWRF